MVVNNVENSEIEHSAHTKWNHAETNNGNIAIAGN